MLRRLTHAAIAFAVTVLAYQAYVLAVVPFVEPATAQAPRGNESPTEWRQAQAAPNRYRELLAAYFPPDHWCFQQSPIAFENGQALVVVDGGEKYTQSDSGKLRVPKCVIIFFPRTRDRTAPPPRDAVVLEPSGGATLQMEERLDPAVSSFGRMQFGQLLGDVTVRSDMREPGPHDDLLVTTRDLYMNEDLIQTTEPVELRLGQHLGRGRGLEIRFLPSESSSPGADAPIYGQLDSLEITHEVSAVIVPDKLSFSIAHRDETPASGASQPPRNPRPTDKLLDAPIRIQSAGPFRINFGSLVASFLDRVQVRQLHPDGVLDELEAHELNLYFTKAMRWNADASDGPPVTPTSESPQEQEVAESFVLEPETIEAVGNDQSPVRLKAPSQEAAAQGGQLYIELTDRRVTLQRGDEVVLNYRGAEIRAPLVVYQLPLKNSPDRVGTLFARGGFGRLTATPDPKRPDQTLEVTWKDSMQLVRSNGQPVLKLDGRPRVSMTTVGTLYADRLELFLRDDASADAAPALGGSHALPSSIKPERLAASDHVVIQSPALNGKVNRLSVKFDYPHPSGPATSASTSPGEAASAAGTAPLNFRSHALGDRVYDIAGVELKLNAVVRDRRPDITRIRVDGAVVFQELPAQTAAAEPPLRITAEHLEVADADTPNAKIDIRGAGGTNGLPVHLAEVAARGALLQAPQLTIHRGTGQAWVNSPGQAQMLMTRDATGAPLAVAQPVAITWQESMKLDGPLVTFLGDVRVQNREGWLRTRRLTVQLTAPVRFEGAGDQPLPELAAVRCDDGAVAEFDQHDETGALIAHQRVELQWLQANQVTGEITGNGPGHVDSLHFSRGAGRLFANPAGTRAPDVEQPSPADDGPPQLRHLSLDFLREISGNLNVPMVSVAGDVKTVYGPVDSWDQRLAMTVGGRPRKDEFWITCQRLQVARSPLSGVVVAADGTRKPVNQVELLAEGNVMIEGEAPEHGAFTMRGHRASYDQPKTQFVLEGLPNKLAVITHQQFPGAPPSDQTFQKLFYYQNTGDVTVQGVGNIQWQDFNPPKKTAAADRR